MHRDPGGTIRFGIFEVDPASGELRKHGTRLKLQEQPFQILTALLERPGEIVTREELRRRVWPIDTFVGFDHGLYSAIKRLRNVLGDSAEVPRYVETVSRRGYRFIAPVETISHANRRLTAQPADSDARQSLDTKDTAAKIQTPGTHRWLVLALLIAGAVSVGGLAAYPLFNRPAHTVALLPFTYPPENKFLEGVSDTLTSNLIVDLTSLNHFGLNTKARAAVKEFKGKTFDPVQAGKALKADLVLVGKVAQVQGQLSIDVDLVSVSDGNSLWAARDLRWEPFEVEVAKRELLGEIVQRLPVKLSQTERASLLHSRPRQRPNPEAEKLTSKAQSLFWTGTPENFRKSIELNQQALRIQESSGPYGAIASTYVAMADLEMISPEEARAKAREWGNRALQGNDTDFGGLIALDRVERNLEWHSQTLKENDLANGRFDTVLAQRRRYQSENPELPASYDMSGADLILARKFSEAAEQEKIALELDPKRAWSHYGLGKAYLHQHRYESAIAEFELSREGLPIHSLTGIACALAFFGKKHEARKKLEDLEALSKAEYISPLMFARIHTALGNRDEAFRYMKNACDSRVPYLLNVKYDPAWDKLRHARRFPEIVRCVGLEP